MHANVKLAMVF